MPHFVHIVLRFTAKCRTFNVSISLMQGAIFLSGHSVLEQ